MSDVKPPFTLCSRWKNFETRTYTNTQLTTLEIVENKIKWIDHVSGFDRQRRKSTAKKINNGGCVIMWMGLKSGGWDWWGWLFGPRSLGDWTVDDDEDGWSLVSKTTPLALSTRWVDDEGIAKNSPFFSPYLSLPVVPLFHGRRSLSSLNSFYFCNWLHLDVPHTSGCGSSFTSSNGLFISPPNHGYSVAFVLHFKHGLIL